MVFLDTRNLNMRIYQIFSKRREGNIISLLNTGLTKADKSDLLKTEENPNLSNNQLVIIKSIRNILNENKFTTYNKFCRQALLKNDALNSLNS